MCIGIVPRVHVREARSECGISRRRGIIVFLVPRRLFSSDNERVRMYDDDCLLCYEKYVYSFARALR